ncbi:3-dehydroquinate synthase II [Pelagirhabdus alkalitolerans]|uniref:3-dehydroquinate synthase II n=1 Tax=Pelagirhabdus alkalitolerans TaxID=1612202 RepID=A0A1G6GJF2_9BACI|nr:3-dehydroquinate synthase II [Pelagirhabdus alkalitolerans]SDB82070.1 3-dehydroquinate synthase II [Pelagirhabdus alkalitolerans]
MSSYQTATVTEVKKLGEGTRVCLDFIDELKPDEGIWIGNTGNGYLMALSENRSTDTYPPRPFRVNAGAYHHYLLRDEEKTGYVAEMNPGDDVFVWHHDQYRQIPIGRIKREKRPFIRVVCQLKNEDKQISVTVQDADSVHLLGADGEPKQAIELVVGDELACRPDQAGRHLGEKITEEIEEY